VDRGGTGGIGASAVPGFVRALSPAVEAEVLGCSIWPDQRQ